MQRTKRTSPSDGINLDDEYRPLTCPNCGTEREGEYCHGCGQRFLKDRLSATELWWIFADRFLDWEEGVWRTFLQMAKSPGVVIRNFLGGKRKTYLNPFSYLLFCVALYGLAQFLMRRISGISTLPDVQDMQQWGMALNNVEDQFTLISYGTVLVVALLAVTMRFMFDGNLLNTMEAVVTALYASGNVFLLAIAVSACEMLLTGDPLPARGLIGVFGVLFPFSMAHSGYGLFEGWGMAVYSGLAPVIASFIAVFFLFPASTMILSVYKEVGFLSVPGVAGIFAVLGGPVVVLALYLLDLLG